MHLAIEAPGVGTRGGRAVLEAMIAELAEDPNLRSVTVFALVDDPPLDGVSHQRVIPNTYAARLAWASFGWAKVSERYDRTLSFSGFARPSDRGDHTCFIHNALYYEDAARLLTPALQTRLNVLRGLTHVSARNSRRVVVQSPHMVEHVWRSHKVRADIQTTIPTLPQAAPGPVLVESISPKLLMVANEVPHKRWDLLVEAVAGLNVSTHFIGFARPSTVHGKDLHFYADRSRAQIHRAMLEADMLINTSECESLCLPLYEAAQASLPIITVDLPYTRFACGDAATYIPAGSEESLRASIQKFT